MTDNVLSWEMQKLLREVSALRAEVAALRREVEAMRATAVADVVDVIVQAFRRLPAKMLTRNRGFRKLTEIK
jgi:outer membrane murein-binding lipoprotein Lpp